ncbi:MAG: SipW-dependent-type signal peptide-containing protein [Micrococcaceae bacterium]
MAATNTNTKRRKVLAVLAGGVVLGVGGAMVLAAWTDSEFATGDFGAGSFNLEGSTASATAGFSDHATDANPAELEFTLPLAENLAPEDVVYAPLWVRLDADTTSPATLAGTGAVGSGENAEHLGYEVYAIGPAADCDASATSGTLISSGADGLNTFTAGDTVPLAVGDGGDAGEAVQLCFVVTASADLEQGEEATGTWQFTATSN